MDAGSIVKGYELQERIARAVSAQSTASDHARG